MKKEIIEHVRNLKEQGADFKVDGDQINDLINKIFDKTYEEYKKKTYIESEIDKFLKDYGDKNIYISYDKDKGTGKYKNKFDTEEITKSLKKLRNKFINLDEFHEEYNKFMNNVAKLENFKSKKEKVSVSPNQKEFERYARDLKDIADLYNIKLDSDTSKKGEGLKILTDRQMLNRLPILLAQI